MSYIIAAARTPMGGFQGELASLTAVDLGARAIAAAVDRAGIDAESVDEVIMGNVLPAGLGQAPARQAMRQAGIPDHAAATTVNKVCGSGMRAVMFAADTIALGHAEVAVAGGMESMSNAPYLLKKARAGYRMGHQQVMDSMFLDGLEDAETGRAMGSFAQDTADAYQLTRDAMDAYAMRSLERANAAEASGALRAEMVPVEVHSRGRAQVVASDEQPRTAQIERIPTLKPAFKSDGTITAANSSSISDGASALVLASEHAVEHDGLEPLARIVGHASHAQHPSEFTTAPIGAIRKLLARIDWSLDDVELFEINEAFAMVAMLAIDELGLDADVVNIYGGACAQGHPIGSTGARLLVTLTHALRARGGKRGVAALCIGGGEATAVAIETL